MLWLTLIGLAAASPDLTVQGAELSVKRADSDGTPMVITADTTRFEIETGLGWFEGSVKAIRGDLVLTADTAEVQLGDQQAVRRAKVTGSVVVTQGDHRATGQQAIIEGDTVVLTGDPVVQSPHHRMEGERLTFQVGEKTVQCDGCTVTVLGPTDQ